MVTGDGITEALAGVTSDALKAAGFSRRRAADASGIPITTLQRRLTGRTPLDSKQLDTLARMAGTTVSALVAEAERRASSPAQRRNFRPCHTRRESAGRDGVALSRVSRTADPQR